VNPDSPLAVRVNERRTPPLGGFSLTFLSIEIRRLLRNRRTVVVTIVVPVETSFSTSWRIFFRSMSRFLRTLAATPEPSCTRPSRMCSVPM